MALQPPVIKQTGGCTNLKLRGRMARINIANAQNCSHMRGVINSNSVILQSDLYSWANMSSALITHSLQNTMRLLHIIMDAARSLPSSQQR